MNMDEEVESKIGYLHMALGLTAGFVSANVSRNAGSIGLVIAYSGFFISKMIFRLSREEYPVNKWLTKGGVPFLMFWLPTWIFLHNI